MRIIGLIILLIIIVVVYTAITIRRLDFTFGLKSIDFSRFGSLTGVLEGKANVILGTEICIYNPLSYGISLSSVKYNIYYQNVLVGKSSMVNPGLDKIKLAGSGKTCFTSNTSFILNGSMLKLIADIKSGLKAEIEYQVTGMLFVVPFSKKDTYKFNS